MLLGEQGSTRCTSMIRSGTGICANIQEARADVIRLRPRFPPG